MEQFWTDIDNKIIDTSENENIVQRQNTHNLDLVETIRERRNEQRKKLNNSGKEKISDIFITQCIVCLVISLLLLITNIFAKDFANGLVSKYCEQTTKDIENFVINLLTKFKHF
ncbi:hypothetical protein FACS1894132_01330 [Clostridia bacterium]|nr:hypothetical protein FACS1894132_01330 [Clostridia bacterium]